jgi:tetratricopeptide (TPR) repeat protein
MTYAARASVLLVVIASLSNAQAPKNPQSKDLKAAVAHFDAERLDQAMAGFAPLAGAGDPDAMYYLGRISFDRAQYDEAIDWFGQAIKRNDASSLYHQWLGSAYAQKLSSGNPLMAMSMAPTVKAEMLRAVELDSSNVDARVNLAAFYMQAPPMIGGSMEKAREQVDAISRLNPFQGRLQEASISEAQKDTAAVLKTLRDLAIASPDSAQPIVRLALIHSNAKRYDEALDLLEGRLKKRPNDPSVLYQLGRVGAVSGLRLDHAQTALHRYLKIPHKRGTPSLAAAHWRLGMILEAKGDARTAKSEYETAVNLDPNLAGAKTSLAKLK